MHATDMLIELCHSMPMQYYTTPPAPECSLVQALAPLTKRICHPFSSALFCDPFWNPPWLSSLLHPGCT